MSNIFKRPIVTAIDFSVPESFTEIPEDCLQYQVDVEEQFNYFKGMVIDGATVQGVNLGRKISKDDSLALYGLYMQATQGDNNTEEPKRRQCSKRN